MTKYERITGGLLIVIGVAVAYYAAVSLKLGTVQEPGPGFFPAVCGLGIVLLCLIWFVGNRTATEAEPWWEPGRWREPLLAGILIAIYTALMEPVGFLASTVVFLLAWQLVVAHANWKRAGVIALIGTVAMYALFSYLLSVPLPEGLLG